MTYSVIVNNVSETLELGRMLGQYSSPSFVYCLIGDLGAGKTQLAKGIAQGLKIKETISSPTFNILKCYFGGILPFYHIDAYRLEDGVNSDIGLEEVIDGDGVCVIEWPTFIKDMIDSSLEINIKILDESKREITFSSAEEKYIKVINRIKENY